MNMKINRNSLYKAITIEFTNNCTEESLRCACEEISKKTGYFANYVFIKKRGV